MSCFMFMHYVSVKVIITASVCAALFTHKSRYLQKEISCYFFHKVRHKS